MMETTGDHHKGPVMKKAFPCHQVVLFPVCLKDRDPTPSKPEDWSGDTQALSGTNDKWTQRTPQDVLKLDLVVAEDSSIYMVTFSTENVASFELKVVTKDGDEITVDKVTPFLLQDL